MAVQLMVDYNEAVELIRGIVGNNEDAIQDVLVELLDKNVSNLGEVEVIAREMKKRHLNNSLADKHKNHSLDAPIGRHKDEGGFTLKDIIGDTSGEAEDKDISDEVKRPLWRVTANVYLDKETADVLRSKHPASTLRDSMRLALGLSPLGYHFNRMRFWQPWEVDIMRKYYSKGGYEAVKDKLNNRTHEAVRGQASSMKLRMTTYNPLDGFMIKSEVERQVGLSYFWLSRLSTQGKLLPKPATFNGRPLLMYDKNDIISFLCECPFDYPHWLVKEPYKKHIPLRILNWLPIDVVARECLLSRETIRRRIRQGLLGDKRIAHYHLVNRDDAIRACSIVMPNREHIRVPYKVIKVSEDMSHYLHHTEKDSEGNIDGYFLCDPNGNRGKVNWVKYRLPIWCGLKKRPIFRAKMPRTLPTCKICLRIGNRIKREKLKGLTKAES